MEGNSYQNFSFRYFAQRTLRIERMYAFWGQDIDKTTTPFDLNREFRVSFDVNLFVSFFSFIYSLKILFLERVYW